MFEGHASDDSLELYCLGQLRAGALEGLEDHLLVCPACQARMREQEEYVRTFRKAAALVAADPPERAWIANVTRLFRPVPLFAAALAAVVLVIVLARMPRDGHSPAPVALSLAGLRGGTEDLRAHAPERAPLTLSLELTGITPLDSYRVRIVNRSGTPVFEMPARPKSSVLVVSVPPALRRGGYWVRVCDPVSQRVLREYGLELE